MSEMLKKAISLHRDGDVAQALSLYEAALAEVPDDLAALYYGGVAAWSNAEFELALARLNRLIDLVPTATAEGHYHRALVLSSLGRDDEAATDYQRAIAIRPDYAPAHNNLGEIFRKQRDLTRAQMHFKQALLADENFHSARYNYALAAQQAGDFSVARMMLGETIRRDPDNVHARAAMVDALLDCAAQAEALTLARASARRLPGAPELWNSLAQAEEAARNFDAAAKAYSEGLRRSPDHPILALNAALLESEQANFSAARELYQSVFLAHRHVGARFRLATLMPTIAESEQQVEDVRQRLRTELQQLRSEAVTVTDPLNDFGDTPFYLSYHGRSDDRVLLGELAQTLRACAPSLTFTATHIGRPRRSGKPRIGICSHFLFDQSVGRSIRAYVRALASAEFELTLLRIPPFFTDSLSRELNENATHIQLTYDLIAARERIAALELDVLIYPEIGMDALTYYLAHTRLARAQWTTLGHPCTSGLETVDAYLSYDALEPAGSERLYSERLIRIPEGSIYPDYPSVELPQRLRSRKELGLTENAPLLICPQSLFKIMPQFDEALRRILDETPNAQILLPTAAHQGQVAAIKRRFERSLGKEAKRITFFSRRSRAEFVELVAACDVLLDPFPVGGGITTWDSIATGTPIVTRPSDLMRSRFALSALQQAGISSTTAHDLSSYVETTTRLLRDGDERAALRTTLAATADYIYRDTRAVAHFMKAVVDVLDN
jgi:protein O-GlcNAc transferase